MSEQTPEAQPEAQPEQSPVIPADEVSVKAQQLASEHGVDPTQVTGTGEAGRVTVADVQQHVAEQQSE
jgi:pyruvate/2-oxoglutarate dehydrogenase complex dihydrolipoamide acyltransferase (E2) component